eukprot:1856407-Pleurochrysis_carterae.AAC.1
MGALRVLRGGRFAMRADEPSAVARAARTVGRSCSHARAGNLIRSGDLCWSQRTQSCAKACAYIDEHREEWACAQAGACICGHRSRGQHEKPEVPSCRPQWEVNADYSCLSYDDG